MIHNNIEDSIKDIISNIFKINKNSINDDFGPNDVEKWDSLNHLKLCIEIEKHFKIKFEADDIESLINFKIIYETVKMHLEEN